MKIFLVAPKSISGHKQTDSNFRFDYAFWNFYFPLISLGHEVTFFDTSVLGDVELKKQIESRKPDLLFCIMTGDSNYAPQEPWNTIELETQKGRLKTFNWFCDDSWRFESFSSKVCHLFHACSTPEARFVDKYKNIGYENIIDATWHANLDFYDAIPTVKRIRTSFVGAPSADRSTFLSALENAGIPILRPKNVGFEDLAYAYASSLIGLNFSKNAANMKPQMKGRMFEIVASRSLLVTEYVPGIEEYFVPDREIVCFKNDVEMVEKVKFLLKNDTIANKIAKNGYDRFCQDHRSRVRLRRTLDSIY